MNIDLAHLYFAWLGLEQGVSVMLSVTREGHIDPASKIMTAVEITQQHSSLSGRSELYCVCYMFYHFKLNVLYASERLLRTADLQVDSMF